MMVDAATAWFHPAFVWLGLGLLLALWVGWRRTVRRGFQVGFGALFIGLLWLAAYDGRPDWPVDLFLLTDPLLALVQGLAARVLVPLTLLSLVALGLAALMGRVFCSHACPLGSLFDLSDALVARRQKARRNHGGFRRARRIKLVLLVALVGAAVTGIDLLGFADPLVLATRFSATVLHPALVATGDAGLQAVRPLAEGLDWTGLAYAELHRRVFDGLLISAGLLLGLLLLGRLQPRFWCRHLCPLGALLGWSGRWAPYRRRVSGACTGCDACTRRCPTGAIHPDGSGTDFRECIVCHRCARVCPEGAVHFGFGRPVAGARERGPRLTRRGFAYGVLGGVVGGLVLRADPRHPGGSGQPIWRPSGRLIRPPGARPESAFLSRCVRCGQCMQACLTNTLQPDWHRGGLEGLWAPRLDLRLAQCEFSCNVCGQVCPTEAIRPLSLEEKQHARLGTAVVDRNHCLAWSQDQNCLVCDEICPCNAIYAQRDGDHSVGLPVVAARRCLGCGACEQACPVAGDAAIQVHAQGEMRLAAGSYVAEARVRGYDFSGGGDLPDQVFEPAGGRPDRAPPAGGGSELPPGIAPAEDEDEDAAPPPETIDPDELDLAG